MARRGVIPWVAEIRVSQGAETERPSALFTRGSGREGHIATIEGSGSAAAVGGSWFDGDLLRPIFDGGIRSHALTPGLPSTTMSFMIQQRPGRVT